MSDDLDYGITTAQVAAHTRATPAELLALAKERAPDPAAFDAVEPYFWPSEISSTRLDAYYGHMAEDTLRNFAADASAGVAILVAHNRWTLPFGMSLNGQFLPADGANPARTISDAYTVPGLKADSGMTSDELITRIKLGIQRDISVGFHIGPRADGSRGRYVCDLCGGNLMDWRACPHYPGLEYEYTDPAGQTSQRLATFTVFNGSLSEYSPVYDGATPGAVILKARAAGSEGLSERQVALLEQRYRSRLPAPRTTTAGVDVPTPEPITTKERSMPPDPSKDPATTRAEGASDDARSTAVEDTAADLILVEGDPGEPATLREIMAACDAAGVPDDLLAPARVRWLADELRRLQPLADDGRQYREDLTAEALAEGVRAQGQAFREETYRGLLATAPITTIRQMRDDWRDAAAQRLPGGRQSRDDATREAPASPAPTPVLPDAIYQH